VLIGQASSKPAIALQGVSEQQSRPRALASAPRDERARRSGRS
jgi:hypothetical protein